MTSARTATQRDICFADFDHTLFSCNSTELFIASCKPSMLVALVDLLVRRCIPWRLTGLEQWFRLRDYACCLCLILLMPWNLLIWRRIAPDLFARLESRMVADRLRAAAPAEVVIVSFGMTFLIAPLLRDSAWRDCQLIATPLRPSWRHFRAGKLAIVSAHFTREEIGHAGFLTDSRDDADLLQAAGRGELILPQGPAFRAEEHLYLPLRYTATAKYTRSYVLDQILFVDMLLIALSISTSPEALLHALCVVPFLTLSLMCIYEIGYHENDTVAARREKSPTLRREAARFRDYPIQVNAWIWAAMLGVAGLGCAWWSGLLGPLDFNLAVLSWAGMLGVLRAVFYIYNRRPPSARIFLYPVLNVMKFAPVFFLIPPTKFGVALALSQVVMMWVVYITYRYGGSHTDIRKDGTRLMLFALGAGLMLSSSSFAYLGGVFQFSVILGWLALRLAKAPLLAALRARRPMLQGA